MFQSEVFEKFLSGDTLEECYAAVAAVADRWLDLLDTKVSFSGLIQILRCVNAAHSQALYFGAIHYACLGFISPGIAV